MKTFYLLGVVNPLNIFLLSIFLQFYQGPKSKKNAIFPTAVHRPVLIGHHFSGPKKWSPIPIYLSNMEKQLPK
jgi:hypothetical protein